MTNEYIRAEHAAELLKVSTRHAHRACQKASVRTQRAGKRILYHLTDVEALAEALGADYRTTDTLAQPEEPKAETTPSPSAELVPAGDLLRHIRELEDRLAHASRHIGQLEGQLETQQRLLQDAQEQIQVLSSPKEQDKPKAPWWRKLLRSF